MFRDEIGSGTMQEGNLDGMECDALGNIWTSGPGGVWVLNPDGERIGAIRTPEICGSVVFGGPDLTTLFLTTTTTVHMMETKVKRRAPLPGADLNPTRRSTASGSSIDEHLVDGDVVDDLAGARRPQHLDAVDARRRCRARSAPGAGWPSRCRPIRTAPVRIDRARRRPRR